MNLLLNDIGLVDNPIPTRNLFFSLCDDYRFTITTGHIALLEECLLYSNFLVKDPRFSLDDIVIPQELYTGIQNVELATMPELLSANIAYGTALLLLSLKVGGIVKASVMELPVAYVNSLYRNMVLDELLPTL